MTDSATQSGQRRGGDQVITHQRLSFRVEEAATATGLSRSRIYQAIGDGSLRSLKDGKRRLVPAKALQDFIAKLERASAGRAA
jgi:excisionase family DNA binding protein